MSEPQTTKITTHEDEDRGSIVDAYCTECGLDRSDDPSITNTKRTPCPNCGMTSLSFARAISETLTMSASLSTSLSPGAQDRDWRLRWQQLERRLPRVTDPRTEQRSAPAIHSATQDLFEFFISAYHLSDALVEDGVVTRQNIDQAMRQNPTLSLLRDLANLDKHRKLKSKPWSGAVPVVKRVSDTSDGPGWQLIVSICHDGVLIDGVVFASEVIKEWRRLLLSWNLL